MEACVEEKTSIEWTASTTLGSQQVVAVIGAWCNIAE